MPRPPYRYSVLAVLLLTTPAVPADPKPADKPAPLSEAAARMTVPEGFRVTLFAGEPDVRQPIAMTFDDRGRMWVVECLSYPKWTSDGTGKDRVTILEDTDGDGQHDKRTVFLDTGSNLSGIALGFGGVWLCSLPNLVFVPDKDGDDKPDGPPEVLLDGWNLKDTKHNVFNSLAWGPDGWLYGCNGIQARSRIGKPGTPDKDRVFMDCGVWRYHPTRKVFEPYAWGTTNPFGLDWDDHGQMFMTNCVIDHLWHVVPGAHFQRMYGQDANPYVFDLMGPASDHKHWAGGHWTSTRTAAGGKPEHSDAGGGHAHSGCSIYLGDNFPPEYRNSVFMCNIHGSRVNRDTLHRENGRYVGKHAPDFLKANDPWFRGICVKYGPDGGLYVSDWTDTGECHNYDKADTTNGRVYKVTFGTPKPWKGDLAKLTDTELVALQWHKNDWFVRQARRLLQERAAAGRLDKDTHAGLRAMLEPPGMVDVPRDLRALWALHVTGGLSREDYAKMLGANNHIRAWAVILGTETKDPGPDFVRSMSGMATVEPDPFVRLMFSAALQRMPADDVYEVYGRFPLRSGDPNTRLMHWYGFQPLVAANPEKALRFVYRLDNPVAWLNTARCVLSLPGDDADARLDMVLSRAEAEQNPISREMLRAILLTYAGRRDVKPPERWADMYPQLMRTSDRQLHGLAQRVGLLFGDERAVAAVKVRLTDATAPVADRIAAVELLAGQKLPGLGPTLRNLLADPAVRRAAVRALAAYPDAETPATILKHYPQFIAEEKADAVQTLASRPAFALALLDAVEKGIVPKADITAFTARQIQALNNKTVSARLAAVWGTVRPASQTRAAQTDRLKTLLTPNALKAADLPNGRRLYAANCASCHKLFGEGGDVGPELTGSQRASLDYVLENVLDPSAVVPGEYRMTTFNLADGRVVTGVVRKETKQVVTIRTVNDEVTVPAADIDARKQTPLSIMPDGLFDTLKDADVRDLVAYLAGPMQVPLPADPKEKPK